MTSNLTRLNTGLTRLASVRQYPTAKKQYVAKRTKGRVFRVGVLHKKDMTDSTLQRNCRGFINAQLNTVAHAPSLYHWLFHRCGIPFAEAQALVKSGGLKVNDTIVSSAHDMESQLSWETFQELDIQVRSWLPTLQRVPPVGLRVAGEDRHARAPEPSEATWVPALKRAMHRTYSFIYIHPEVSISSDLSDPRSFVHRVAPMMGADASASLGLNVLHPIGFLNGMKGIGIASNDVAMLRYWNNDALGNFGIYDVRFPRGTPSEVVRRAARDVEKTLGERVQAHLPSDAGVSCACLCCPPPPSKSDTVANRLFPTVPLLTEERLLITTPLLPYVLARRLRKCGALTALVRSGPFVLHPSLVQAKMRRFNPTELALLFTFERRLKVNRMVLSLREFGAGEETM